MSFTKKRFFCVSRQSTKTTPVSPLFQIDRILDTWTVPELLKDYYLGGWHHSDTGGYALLE